MYVLMQLAIMTKVRPMTKLRKIPVRSIKNCEIKRRKASSKVTTQRYYLFRMKDNKEGRGGSRRGLGGFSEPALKSPDVWALNFTDWGHP
jgi:hypothetical protein